MERVENLKDFKVISNDKIIDANKNLLLSQLLLNGAIDADLICIIEHQAISFGEVLQLTLPVVVEGSARKAIQVERCLQNEKLFKD